MGASFADLSDDEQYARVYERSVYYTGLAPGNPTSITTAIAMIKQGIPFPDQSNPAVKYPGNWSGFVTYLYNSLMAKSRRARNGGFQP